MYKAIFFWLVSLFLEKKINFSEKYSAATSRYIFNQLRLEFEHTKKASNFLNLQFDYYEQILKTYKLFLYFFLTKKVIFYIIHIRVAS